MLGLKKSTHRRRQEESGEFLLSNARYPCGSCSFLALTNSRLKPESTVDSKNKPIFEELLVRPPPPGGCLAKILRPFAELEHRYLVMKVDPERYTDYG